MPQYILLLHENPASFTGVSPEELQKMFGEYKAWRGKIQADGVYVGGNKLRDEGGKHLSGSNGSLRVTDGPFAEAKEVIGGYFIISADSYEEAAKVSEGCPHLKFGGRIELREIEPTS
jgi:hypothetical protein